MAEHIAGFVAVATQVGYALGDVAEPRRLVRALIAVTALGLPAIALAPGIPMLLLASVVVASATVVAQVATQTRIFLLPQAIRSRLNTVYMAGVFSGSAFGSMAGTSAWSLDG